MPRKPLVVGNWKMHHSRAQTRTWCGNLRDVLTAEKPWRPGHGPTLGVAPPFTALPELVEATEGLGIIAAAQNCHWETEGAFTGEIAPHMLAELGCEMVIVGHSERRHVFGESDQAVGKKAAAVREAGMVPILCVGETQLQRESGRTELTIEGQLRRGCEHLRLQDPGRLVLAYEPVWAIGTGQVATPDQAQTAHGFLRGILGSVFGRELAEGIRILYGGSVKPGNAGELAAEPDIDGFLVGGASLDAGSLVAIGAAFA